MDIKKTFLQQSYNDNWSIYKRTLEKGSSIPKWDLFIITASNEEQARAYRLQLEMRRKNGYLPADTEFLVIADPDGKRVGSGGATLNALYEAYNRLKGSSENPFRGKRIIMIHSGGDSKRIPQYSAFGKLFSKVPRELPDGRYSTLFDEFLISLSGLPTRMKDGLLIASGDVLLLFNHNQIDLGRQGAVGIAIKVSTEKGSHHGVYLGGEDSKVDKFLHKMPVEVLQKEGAVNSSGLVNVDTGLIWMDGELTGKLAGLIMSNGEIDKRKYYKFVNDKLRLNFYGDFILPLTRLGSLEGYLKEESEGEYCDELIEVRKTIWETMNGHNMYVQALSPAEFIHFGTTSEFRDLMGEIDSKYSYLSWKKQVVSFGESCNHRDDIALINSYVSSSAVIGEGSLLEDSDIKSSSYIGEGSVISNVIIEKPINLEDNLVIHQLPVRYDGNLAYVTRVYGVYDNPKYEIGKASFLNKPFKDFMALQGISEKELWGKGVSKDLWNAKLYPVCHDKEKSLDFAVKLSKFVKLSWEEKLAWLSSERVSLKESYEMADLINIIETQNNTEDKVRVEKFISEVKKGKWVKEVYSILGSSEDQVIRRLNLVINYTDSLKRSILRARLYRAVADVLRYFQGNKNGLKDLNWRTFEDKCYEDINNEIQENTINLQEIEVLREISASSLDVLQKENVERKVYVEAPARVNFGGGWSDTPPYSIETGGTVLNAAISLNGKFPIRVTAELINEPYVVLTSKDLDITSTFTSMKELQKYKDPTDPLALHKAALAVIGIIPAEDCMEECESLEDRLKGLGGGVALTTEVDIPKGSGLGTSSILAGAVLKALNDLFKIRYDDQRIFDQVLCLEQLLTTGGGWQDQVGGLLPGVKLVTSVPGLPQKISSLPLKLSDDTLKELKDRLILVYTGQRRLAKGILRDIMGEYIINNPVMLTCLSDIQRLALLMKFELEKGNVDAFAELLNEHWELSKKLDAGCTNSYINQIIEVCKPYVSGVMICGAGGGGFLQMMLKDGSMREPLRKTLEAVFQDNNVGIWDCEIV